ncbi:MAG: efflux RND transporter periplasmic adaptor subunit [Phycisphaerales bacterium]|nr:efflux RND transporter periplasmic adaptor subunit [Phycisphaerales bacterium]
MTQKPSMTSTSSMTSSIPLPSVRIGTRVVLPAVIVLSALAILAWSSWRAWAPLTTVRAVPVIIRAVGASTSMTLNSPASNAVLSNNTAMNSGQMNSGQMNSGQTSAPRGAVVQAPGWVEPSPFPIAASALISGVVREVLVLEGDHVEKDQVVARLINDQAKIALRGREADVKIKSAELAMLQDELARKQKLVAGGGVSDGEVARLAIKVLGAKAVVEQADAARAEAELALGRTEVRAPVAGVVMARLVAPGSLVGMDASTAAVAQLFDPKNLQVRTDVPLADAGKLRVGQQALVQFDSLPGQTVRGRVLRLVQQADIAKNTLQAKVLLENPPLGLVPDMLARVRIFLDSAPAPTSATSAAQSANAPSHANAVNVNSASNTNAGAMQATNADMNSGASSRTEIAAPESVLAQTVAQANGTRAGTVRVVVDVRDGVGRIESREVVCAAPVGEWTAVQSGLRPGDFVVLPNSPSTSDGQIVRMEDAAATTEASDATSDNASMSSDNADASKKAAPKDTHANH